MEPWAALREPLTAFFSSRKGWPIPWSRLRFAWGGSWLRLGQRIRPDMDAVTWDHTIQIAPALRDSPALPWLLAHELTHVLQWERGGLGFALDYAIQFVSRSIERNTFEREANSTADDFEAWRNANA